MHSEADIRRSIKILLEAYGSLDTSEVKEHLSEVLTFDDEDLMPSGTRAGETLIVQRIGNVVSHQTDLIRIYSEGFVVDKNYSPALWSLIMGSPDAPVTISEEEVGHRRERLNPHPVRRYRKINWDEVNERQSVIGRAGEEFVFRNEVDFARSIDERLVERVQHLSVKQGDGFGYDVLSIDENGYSKFIEVKTTTSKNPFSPFYMSVNEKNFFEENINNNAFIYRVYDFDLDSMQGKVMVISAFDLLNNFEFDPISFKVTHKE